VIVGVIKGKLTSLNIWTSILEIVVVGVASVGLETVGFQKGKVPKYCWQVRRTELAVSARSSRLTAIVSGTWMPSCVSNTTR
jgi:hypothetical protein